MRTSVSDDGIMAAGEGELTILIIASRCSRTIKQHGSFFPTMFKGLYRFLFVSILIATFGAFTSWCPEDCYWENAPLSQSNDHSLPKSDSHPCQDCCSCACNISFCFQEANVIFDLPLLPITFFSNILAPLLEQTLSPLEQPPRSIS